MERPLSYIQAEQIRRSYEFLKGACYDKNLSHLRVGEVAIVPWDDLNRFLFMEYYRVKRSAENALHFYHREYFGVAILAREATQNICYMKELKTYCQEFGIPYDIKLTIGAVSEGMNTEPVL